MSCEDQVFEYDALAFEKYLVIVVNCSPLGYMEHVTMTSSNSISVCLV